jgi:hypothetical protein
VVVGAHDGGAHPADEYCCADADNSDGDKDLEEGEPRVS